MQLLQVCFVENTKTDTQAAVWRNSARRQVVVAFRGTEMAKLKDIATDARQARSVGWRACVGSVRAERGSHPVTLVALRRPQAGAPAVQR